MLGMNNFAAIINITLGSDTALSTWKEKVFQASTVIQWRIRKNYESWQKCLEDVFKSLEVCLHDHVSQPFIRTYSASETAVIHNFTSWPKSLALICIANGKKLFRLNKWFLTRTPLQLKLCSREKHGGVRPETFASLFLIKRRVK